MAFEVAKGIARLGIGTRPVVELDFRPRAIVLWWCRDPSQGCAGGIGFATDGAGDASAAWAADDTLAPGVLSHWGADAPLLFHADPRRPEASCHAQIRFADEGFSFEYDRPPEHPWLVHYLAIGGTDLVSSAVHSFALDDTGTYPVTGLDFTPSAVLAAVGAGSQAGEPRSGLAVGFGAAARQSNQVASGFVSKADAGGTIVRGAQCTDALALLPVAEPSGDFAALSRLASFDQEGFTLETTHLTYPLPLAVLALEGGAYKVDLGTASSRTTAVGLEPAGALLFGTGLNAARHARQIGRVCVGGFSRDQSAGCVSWSTHSRGAWPPQPRSRSSTEAAFEVVDTTSDELHAQATLAGFGRGRFSLSWPVRDRAPRDFGYAAFGTEVARPTLGDRLRLLGRAGALRK